MYHVGPLPPEGTFANLDGKAALAGTSETGGTGMMARRESLSAFCQGGHPI